jgi:hypothetical protein
MVAVSVGGMVLVAVYVIVGVAVSVGNGVMVLVGVVVLEGVLISVGVGGRVAELSPAEHPAISMITILKAK